MLSKKQRKVKVSKELSKIFTKEFNQALVHQVMTDFMSNQRSGTKAQKNRSAVSGGGAKPRPQKGSGRARAGTTRSPIWRTGGVTFAAQPKDYNKKINKKMYKGALNCIFNELLKRKRLHLTDKLSFTDKKTKLGKALLDKLKLENALFITSLENTNAFFSLRNIKNVTVLDCKEINPHILMKHDNVVIDSNILEQLKQATSL
tara:strand:+ start:3842 stop:4450 length:609 start_codon:yes stop_codon:yes gene_type:complete